MMDTVDLPEHGGEHLVLPYNALAFYLDESGDESLRNADHPIFAFGGVACVTQSHLPLAQTWKAMKREAFRQVSGPLHAASHMQDGKISSRRRAAVLSAINQPLLARLGAVVTTETQIEGVGVCVGTFEAACFPLTRRVQDVARKMYERGYWCPTGSTPVYAIFEHSSRIAQRIEACFQNISIEVGGLILPVQGCFMPKTAANPFLEMADFVAYSIGRNVIQQRSMGRDFYSPTFREIFQNQDAAISLVSYIEVTAIVPSR